MAIYAMADLHLSLATDKSMDIFPGWSCYEEKIAKNCGTVLRDDDTLVIPGDLSWAMTLPEALEDFRFIHKLPGSKIILKGNHDYFWTTRAKMEKFFLENGLAGISILHNNAIACQNYAVCGTRGWVNDGSQPADQRVILREAGRLQTSINEAKKLRLPILCFLHYPPVYGETRCDEILQVLLDNRIERCYYGHIHGAGHRKAVQGDYMGIDFRLVSADYLDFIPQKVV